MARALGEDIPVRVLKAAGEGASARQAAARFGVGLSSAISWIAAMPRGGGKRWFLWLIVVDFILAHYPSTVKLQTK